MSDRRRLSRGADPAALVRFAEAAGKAELAMVQIREPDLPARELYGIVASCVEATRGTPTRIVVNDRLDVALAAGADGVHLRATSCEAPRVRRLVPEGCLVGQSVHHTDEACDRAAAGGLDYLILGTIFPSASKPSGHVTLGARAVAAARTTGLPVLAIGGMTAQTIPLIASAGAAGFAAISYFVAAYRSGSDGLAAAASEARRWFDTPGPVA